MPQRQQQPQHDPEYLDEDHQRISEFARDYFDDDEEREAFTETLMTRRGYTKRAAWGPPAEQDPQGGNGQDPQTPKQPPTKTPYFRR